MPYAIPYQRSNFCILWCGQDPIDQLVMKDYAWILGWDIQSFSDFDKCRDWASTNHFDLFVADLCIGKSQCGLEALRTIRSDNPSNWDAPGLLLADDPIPSSAIRKAEQIGGAAFRMKPLILSDLKWLVERFTKDKPSQ